MKLSDRSDPTKQECNHRPLCVKQLAVEFGVGVDYVYAMRDAGAPFWGRVSTVAAIMEWWAANPTFSRSKARKREGTTAPGAVPVPLQGAKRPARNGEVFVV